MQRAFSLECNDSRIQACRPGRKCPSQGGSPHKDIMQREISTRCGDGESKIEERGVAENNQETWGDGDGGPFFFRLGYS